MICPRRVPSLSGVGVGYNSLALFLYQVVVNAFLEHKVLTTRMKRKMAKTYIKPNLVVSTNFS
jgi:hypothetical protein